VIADRPATAPRVKRPGGGVPEEPAVEVGWGLAYELLLGLRMFVDTEDPASYEEGPGWFDGVRARAPATLLRSIERFSGGHECNFGNLLGLLTAFPSPTEVPALLEMLGDIDPMRLRLQLLGHQFEVFREGIPRELIQEAAGGDKRAIRTLLSQSRPDLKAAASHVLSLDAVEARDLLLDISRGWDEHVLQPEGRSVARLLRHDAEEKLALASRMKPAELVEHATNGIALSRDPRVRRVMLVPSLVHRPWVVMGEHYGSMLFFYGLAAGPDRGADEPPEELLRLTKALGDDTRLRLLRRLRGREPVGLQELADHVGLAKSTVHAHMLVLRTSGLVRAGATDKRYSIRPEGLERARELLGDWLGGGWP